MALTKGKTQSEKQIKKLEDDKELLEAAVATGAVGGSSDQSEQASLLQSLILERLQKKQAEEQAAEERFREVQKQRQLQIAAENQRQREQKMANQQWCSHLDEHGKARTGGQLNSDGYYGIMCLACAKQFTDKPGGEPCPPHLLPKNVGGAVMEGVNRTGTRI